MNKQCIVVLPWYTNELTKEETYSLKSFNKHLSKEYVLSLACPHGFEPNHELLPETFELKYYDTQYFESAYNYNSLLFLKEFYHNYSDYEYLLIYQFDAIVFKNELEKWCNKGYDYIGSPWFWDSYSKQKNLLGKPFGAGNGGFSLRKIDSFLAVLNSKKKIGFREFQYIQERRLPYHPFFKRLFYKVKLALKSKAKISIDEYLENHFKAEDIFWGLTAKHYKSDFKVANFEESIGFSFEYYPEKLFELNQKELPFGAHAWWKHNLEFFKPYLKVYE